MRAKSSQIVKGRFVSSERSDIHRLIRWLKIVHRDVLYLHDYGADALLTPRQAKERKDLSCTRGWPDLILMEPRGGFSGLALDLKRQDVKIFNAKGLYANPHFEQQAEVMDKLRARGFDADFVKGFDEAVKRITLYLNLK